MAFLAFMAFLAAVVECNSILDDKEAVGASSRTIMQAAPYAPQYGVGMATTFLTFIALMTSITLNVRYGSV